MRALLPLNPRTAAALRAEAIRTVIGAVALVASLLYAFHYRDASTGDLLLVVAIFVPLSLAAQGWALWSELRAPSEHEWDWDRMTADLRRSQLRALPVIRTWRDGVFVDGNSNVRTVDPDAVCAQLELDGDAADVERALQDALAGRAHLWHSAGPGRVQAVFDVPAADAGPLALSGARMWLRVEQLQAGRCRLRVVAVAGGRGGVDVKRVLADEAGGAVDGAAGYLVDVQRELGAAASWVRMVLRTVGAQQQAAELNLPTLVSGQVQADLAMVGRALTNRTVYVVVAACLAAMGAMIGVTIMLAT